MQGLPIKAEDLRIGDCAYADNDGFLNAGEVTEISEDCIRYGRFNRYKTHKWFITHRNNKHVIKECPKPGDKVELSDLLPGDIYEGKCKPNPIVVIGTKKGQLQYYDKVFDSKESWGNDCLSLETRIFISRSGVTDKEGKEEVQCPGCNSYVQILFKEGLCSSCYEIKEMREIEKENVLALRKEQKQPFETHVEKVDRMKRERDKEIVDACCDSSPDIYTREFEIEPVEMQKILKQCVSGLPKDAAFNLTNFEFALRSYEFKSHGKNKIIPDGKGWKVEGT